MSIAMIAMTTSNSISVNAVRNRDAERMSSSLAGTLKRQSELLTCITSCARDNLVEFSKTNMRFNSQHATATSQLSRGGGLVER